MSQRWRIAPSELDCNLAVSAYLRACTKFPAVDRGGGTQALALARGSSGNGATPAPTSGGSGDVSASPSSPGIAAADLSELFPLLFRMQVTDPPRLYPLTCIPISLLQVAPLDHPHIVSHTNLALFFLLFLDAVPGNGPPSGHQRRF